MIISKINKVENRSLILVCALALTITLIAQTTVLADTNNATQEASSNKIETIAIKTQDGTTAEITTITFPAGAPSAEVTAPYNNSNGAGSPQVLNASTSTPVATLVSATTYNLYVSVTDTSNWNATVTSENVFCTSATNIDLTAFDSGKSTITVWDTVTDMGSQTVTTANKFLYLTVDLTASAGLSGTSTIEVYGETP